MQIANVSSTKSIVPSPIINIKSAPDECCEEHACRIAEAAYFKAQARGFEPGHDVDDWLEAEKEAAQ